MKRIFRLSLLAGSIVMAAVLASLAPTSSSRVYAQVTVQRYHGYYNPYGRGVYGGYGQRYAAFHQAKDNMFPNHSRMIGNRAYGHSSYAYVPSGYGFRYDDGIGPQVRVYGRSSYYQPSYRRVYVPFGGQDY